MAEAARKAKAEESASSAATVKRASEPGRATIARAALDGRRSTLLSPKSIQPSLRVSQPSDAAEVEADRVAKAVVSMPDPSPAVSPRGAPAISRKAAPAAKAKGAPAADAKVEAEVRAAASGGTPLPMKTRKLLEPRFRANFAGVRIHTDGNAAKLANKLNARAFAFGNHIFFGGGAYDPNSKAGLELLAHELTHTIQQGESIQRKADTSEARVSERTPRQASRLGLSDALDFFADAANAIPGYRMFTILIGVNPINMSAVEASAANILRAIVEFLPGGNIITRVLDSYGIFDKVGGWIEGQLKSLGISGASIKAALNKFMDSLSWRDIFNLSGVWGRAKAIFTEPIGKIISFAKSLFSEILRMVREAVLRPLAALAEGSPGYPLLKVILGFDPVTGEAVQPTADAVIGGLMTLIGQEELWANIKRANAIPRAWAWFKGAMGGLKALVTSIPSRFMTALKGLEIMDFVVLPSAFIKLAKVFGNFMGDFGSWALGTVLDLLKIIVEVVAPGVMPYIAKAGAAFNKILKNPVGFVQTLVRAAMQGFRQFASNFLTHLKASLVGWLTGAMSGAGVYIPQGFSLREILKFVLSVLGLTWANIRGKLVAATSETVVKSLELGFDLVKTLVTEGPAAAWQKILESLTNLKDMVIQQVMDFVKSKVVEAAVTKLVSMLSPAGAVIQAIIAIYNTVMFFVERLKQIAAVAASFIDSLATIAAGNVGPAANRVEQTMAGLLTLVISFLARIAGLGKVSDAVVKLVAKVRAPIDKGLDKVVAWIVTQAKKLGKMVAQAGVPQDPAARLKLASRAAVLAAKTLSGKATKPALLAVLAAVKLRYALTSIDVFQQGKVWRATARINPELTFDILDNDDDLLPRLHAAFTKGVTQLEPLSTPERLTKMQDVFERAFRQEHTGLVVKTANVRGKVKVSAKPSGKPVLAIGEFDSATGKGQGDPAAEIASALVRARAAIGILGPTATWQASEAALRNAVSATGLIKASMVSFVHTDAPPGSELIVTLTQRRSLGVLRRTADSLFVPHGSEGFHTLYKNRLDGSIVLMALKDIPVQQFVWRAITPKEREILETKFNAASANPWPQLPSRPGKGKRTSDPVTHIVDASVPSEFTSATMVEEAKITNRRSAPGQAPQNFRTEKGGMIKINLAHVPAANIFVVGSTTAVTQWKFGPADAAGRADAIATREVLIKGGVPAAAIVQVKYGAN
ncbi:MAG: DUF4157 domain-containing protein [Sphingomonas sp.]